MAVSSYVARLRERVGHDLLLLPSVGAVVLNAYDEILLGRRADTGMWALVGGIVDPDEQPADAVVREVYEETAVGVAPERITGVYLSPRVRYPHGDVAQYVTTVFACRVVSGSPRVNDDESLEVAYFSPNALPTLTDGHRRRILDALSGHPAAAFEPAAADDGGFDR